MSLRSLIVANLLLAYATAMSGAETSIYFRSDNGLPAGAGKVPDNLDTGSRLAWRTQLDSGHSTPIIHAGKIFLTTSRVENNELATVALDAATGRVLWTAKLPVPKIEEVHPEEGNGAMATPATDGERLFVFFGSHGLICYDLNGKLLWDAPLGPFRDEYGAASSPVIVGDKIILNQDHDIDSFLMALDRSTGRVLWKTVRPDAVRSYATPSLWTQNGKQQLLVAGALELAAYDPSNGEKLWWVNGLARIVIPTPLANGDTIYMASWAPGGDAGQRLSLVSWPQALEKWDKNKDGRLAKDEIQDREVVSRFFRMDLDQSGLLDQKEWEAHAEVFRRAQNALLALQPKGRGNLTDSALLWNYQRGIPYVASPLLHNGILWLVKDGGLATKLDAATGQLLQQERLPATGNYYASPVAADGKIYFASESGVLAIAADERDWRIISSHPFKEKIYATPLIHENRLYIRTEKALYCFERKDEVQ
ncbi:MAG TPA: PQQ-binding-like beta-propeller repeat protein [Verrucomicrobiae bacterium]|jgi:outer membrane protein assembly factor BamB|nr:PQQ-binding-like beta-propeller repeat protein [Verrucomicrobiae bacterium]